MKKFTSLTFLAFVLLFFIVVSSASPSNNESTLEKRTNVCSQKYKRGVLGKRTNVKKCPCALASAPFEGKVTGLVVMAQDECGETTVTGFFSKGLDNPENSNYTFAIADDCGKIINELGNLGAIFTDNGTKPFAQKFDTFNLNCDKDGILLRPSAKLSKRTYDQCKKSYYKRAGFTDLNIYSNGGFYSGAPLNAF